MKSKNKKILITGSKGFIGSHLKHYLKSKNYKVLCFPQKKSVCSNSVWQQIDKAGVCIHLASRCYVPQSWNNPQKFFTTNILGTLNAILFCIKHDSTLIYLSAFVYKKKNTAISESSSRQAYNPYSLTKILAEDIIKFYQDFSGLKCVVIRPFNCYGKNQKKTFLIPKIIYQIKNKKSIILNSLVPKRDYVYVKDLVYFIEKVIKSKKYNLIFNVGTGTSTSVKKLTEYIQNVLKTNKNIKSLNDNRKNEVMNSIAAISKAQSILNWKPKFNLQSGLADFLVK